MKTQKKGSETSNIRECKDVFKCPYCGNFFSHSEYLPLALPCGHVVCKVCLSRVNTQTTVLCPLDNIIHHIQLSSLQLCQAIMEYLPHQHQPADFVCKYHNDKRIKYICEYDNETFCSLCFREHSKLPHNAQNFIPSKKKIYSEVELISKRINAKRIELSEEEKKLNEFRYALCNRTREELSRLERETERILIKINEMKSLYEEKIKNLFKYKIQEIDENKLKIERQITEIEEIEEKIKEFGSNYLSKKNLNYDETIENKNEIIYKWECFFKLNSQLTSSSTSNHLNSLILPKLKFTQLSFDNSFIKFEQENYSFKHSETIKENMHSGNKNIKKVVDSTGKQNRQHFIDIKGESKPVMINEYNNLRERTNNDRRGSKMNYNISVCASQRKKGGSLNKKECVLVTN